VLAVDLLPGLPADEAAARWQTTTSACCVFHYLKGSAAARDIDTIAKIADQAIDFVEARLDVAQKERLKVYLLNRVLGHGGFAGANIAITYIDRDYAGGGLLEVMRHEGTHLLDRQIADGERPAMLVEGFATYVTGGHFKLEPLPERAAALLELGDYIPLRQLANDFYPSQHETGYLEAGAFIDYLVQRADTATFIELYDGMARKPGESDADMIDRELQAVYGIGLGKLESEWQSYLRELDVRDQPRDVTNTIAFYDAVRRYQRTLDPSAYFLEAWIPDIEEAERRGLIADFSRHPRAPEDIALETMFVAADEAFDAGDFERVEALLGSINAVLDAGVVFDDPSAAHYLSVVEATLSLGYEPQKITLRENHAEVLASRAGEATLVSLSAALQNGAWSVQLSR
jgi:hypothetical protein